MAEKKTVVPAPRLKALYQGTYLKELQAELNLKNVHEVPALEKIVVSVGTGKRKMTSVISKLSKTLSRKSPVKHQWLDDTKSIATFSIRKGMGAPIGVSVTLRGARMYEFIDRLINVALPRVRDFHGVGLKFDKGGNYNLGITEQSIFPELTFEETQVLHGLQVTFVIKNGNKEASKALLEKFGMPFEKKGGVK